MRKWVRKQFSKSAKDRSYEQRTIQLNDPHNRTNFCDNHIYSSRYNIFTFLPLNLWEQLHRPINIYFLLIAALQFIPSVAPVSPLTTIFPITVAFLVNTVKEGIDDVRRHRQDAEMNERVYQRVRHGTLELESVASADIHVGDVLILHPFEIAPSDVVILLTSHDSGSAHITTESLDGETGSKKRFAILHQLFKHSQAASSPIAVEPRFRGSTFGTTPTPDSDAAGVDASEAKGIEKRTDVPTLDLRRCCNTVEDHQLHCLRYAYRSRVVLHSEGPNAQLHSYHGSATVCTPRSSLRTWRENRPLTRTTGSDTGDAVKKRGATSDLSTGFCYGVVPAEAALPISADRLHPQEADMSEAVQRHLPMPVMVPLLPCQRTARTVDSMIVESFSSSVDERSGLLGSGGPSQASALLRQSLSQREAGAYDYFDGPEQTLPVTIDNVVYSSSRIGNTHFVIALVVFTGCDTKISMARNVLPTKWPTIDYRFNYLTMLIFCPAHPRVHVCLYRLRASQGGRYSLVPWRLSRPDELQRIFPHPAAAVPDDAIANGATLLQGDGRDLEGVCQLCHPLGRRHAHRS
ncbi:phospholipid-transporting ATPase-like protein [Leishmania tarentolae]|uniref:Phospholipid-transporting ATPase-like protein n=1 Tax=Leishmania tarentolae TaxID=5689 RepID=A0A640KSG5_LEITA|nr:phospholipid-transporting ATPase-like protein [Leishmania tarentolae]